MSTKTNATVTLASVGIATRAAAAGNYCDSELTITLDWNAHLPAIGTKVFITWEAEDL